jgi:O-antigen chain-terminating methyltransferase
LAWLEQGQQERLAHFLEVANIAKSSTAQARAIAKEIADLKREVLFQQRRLSRIAMPSAGSASQVPAEIFDGRIDAFYSAFEDHFRGDRSAIKERILPYLERISVCGAGQSETPIVDLGCGRGEWIELLRDRGFAAYGVDGNAVMVDRCQALGLDARREDLLDHLHGLADRSRSAVTAFHVVEHLPLGVLIDLIDEALRVLIPGGLLIMETPNPETMRVGATTFYYDLTHRHPIMPAVLQFMVQHRGFSEAEILRLHPFTEGLLTGRTRDAELLNQLLFGPQDFAIIARRG